LVKAVLVLSGKGGVGKTLISVNIALHLAKKGLKAGLLDADFSASNTGFFFDVKDAKLRIEKEKMYPAKINDLEYFSMPLFIGEKGVSMTGDQYAQLFKDVVLATQWESEYLIVDFPAGHDDRLKVAATVFKDCLLGSIIVMQPAHELDAIRALQLHQDLEMPVLGIIENMSYMKVGKVQWKIFGESVVDKLGNQFNVDVFGKIPLSMQIRKQVEEKNPLLQGEYADPILSAVEAIKMAKPTKPGFITKIKQWLQSQMVKLVVTLIEAINLEVNVTQLQQTYGYEGGRIIRLNIYEENMEKLITQTDLIINEGKLTGADGKYHIDAQIDITPQAVKWTLLGDKITSTGAPYTFQDAMRLGHMRIYGDRTMINGAFFVTHVFEAVRNNEKAMNRIKPILELI